MRSAVIAVDCPVEHYSFKDEAVRHAKRGNIEIIELRESRDVEGSILVEIARAQRIGLGGACLGGRWLITANRDSCRSGLGRVNDRSNLNENLARHCFDRC